MIIGYDIFGGSTATYLRTTNAVSKLYDLNLLNSKVDEINMRNNTVIPFSADKSEWDIDNILLARFQNSLEGGNIDLHGAILDKLIFKKRRTNDVIWTKIYECEFISGTNIYSLIDKIVEAGEEYEYAIVPVTSNIEGEYLSNQIVAEFEATFIFDRTTQFKLMYNLQMGDITTYIPNSIVETMSGKYPMILYNADLNYKKGTIQCLLLSDTTLSNNDGKMAIKQEKSLRDSIMSFLTNKKPKAIKSADGGLYMIINIVGEPQLIPNGNINGMYDVSFQFIESGSLYDIDDLTESGLI